MSLVVSIKKSMGEFTLRSSFETDGGILGFLGASGSGKSMTLKCIAGIETPDEGQILLNGVVLFDKARNINLPPQKRRVGYLFQNYALFPNMTVEQNILCGLHRTKDKTERLRLAGEVMEKLALTGLEGHRPSQLSGGQQQRVALARIFVSQPDILLLDEPFSALDSHLRLQLETELKRFLTSFGKDVIMVSHNRDEIFRICREAAIMDEGRILLQGMVREVFSNPQSRRGAQLTGCKNIHEARKTGEYEVEVPGWGMRFATKQPVGENLCAIGIRAHYFDPDIGENQGNVIFAEEIEEPFEWIVKFRYENMDEASESVWWRVSKERRPSAMPARLGVARENIMLLYQ